MKKVLNVLVLFLSTICLADPPIPVQIIDFNQDAPKISLFNNSIKTYTFQLQNYGVIFDATNRIPYCYIISLTSGTNPVNGSCSWISQTTCVFSVTFVSNNLPVNGKWTYGIGLSNALGNLTFKQGAVDILPDTWR